MVPALEFEAVTKRYGSQVALDGLSLKVQAGEIVGFIGPNGAGKTTAISTAMGFLFSDSGRGSIAGHPFGSKAARSQTGFLPDAPVFFACSAAESLSLARRWKSASHPGTDWLRALDLPASRDSRKLSRGMQQKLGLAQALIGDPALLILDEPTSALDPNSVFELREILQRLRNQGKAVFFSSHQLGEVEELCDRVAFLHHGRLLREGTVRELTESAEQMEVCLTGIAEDHPALAAWRPFRKTPSREGAHCYVIPRGEHRMLVESAWAAGGELLLVRTLHRSLEELFLEWTGEKAR